MNKQEVHVRRLKRLEFGWARFTSFKTAWEVLGSYARSNRYEKYALGVLNANTFVLRSTDGEIEKGVWHRLKKEDP